MSARARGRTRSGRVMNRSFRAAPAGSRPMRRAAQEEDGAPTRHERQEPVRLPEARRAQDEIDEIAPRERVGDPRDGVSRRRGHGREKRAFLRARHRRGVDEAGRERASRRPRGGRRGPERPRRADARLQPTAIAREDGGNGRRCRPRSRARRRSATPGTSGARARRRSRPGSSGGETGARPSSGRRPRREEERGAREPDGDADERHRVRRDARRREAPADRERDLPLEVARHEPLLVLDEAVEQPVLGPAADRPGRSAPATPRRRRRARAQSALSLEPCATTRFHGTRDGRPACGGPPARSAAPVRAALPAEREPCAVVRRGAGDRRRRRIPRARRRARCGGSSGRPSRRVVRRQPSTRRAGDEDAAPRPQRRRTTAPPARRHRGHAALPPPRALDSRARSMTSRQRRLPPGLPAARRHRRSRAGTPRRLPPNHSGMMRAVRERRRDSQSAAAASPRPRARALPPVERIGPARPLDRDAIARAPRPPRSGRPRPRPSRIRASADAVSSIGNSRCLRVSRRAGHGASGPEPAGEDVERVPAVVHEDAAARLRRDRRASWALVAARRPTGSSAERLPSAAARRADRARATSSRDLRQRRGVLPVVHGHERAAPSRRQGARGGAICAGDEDERLLAEDVERRARARARDERPCGAGGVQMSTKSSVPAREQLFDRAVPARLGEGVLRSAARRPAARPRGTSRGAPRRSTSAARRASRQMPVAATFAAPTSRSARERCSALSGGSLAAPPRHGQLPRRRRRRSPRPGCRAPRAPSPRRCQRRVDPDDRRVRHRDEARGAGTPGRAPS